MPTSDDTLQAKQETSQDFIQTITVADLPLVEEMYSREGDKYKNNTAENFAWWYFKNPSASRSLFGVNMNQKIEGFASTNNFWFQIEGQKKLAAMIQKVITLPGIRGKGYFGKLLKELEKDNLNRNNADLLVGFPNGQAAPIYIQKFAYKWAEQLRVQYTPSSFFGRNQIKRITDVGAIKNFKGIQLDNAVIKTEAFYKWRYSGYPEAVIHILEITKNDKVAGYSFIKTFHKKKIPFFILMDLILYNEADLKHVFKQLKLYCGKHKHAGLLFVKTTLTQKLKNVLVLNTTKKFDYMVKGKTDQETDHLKTIFYNFYFGDMDFF